MRERTFGLIPWYVCLAISQSALVLCGVGGRGREYEEERRGRWDVVHEELEVPFRASAGRKLSAAIGEERLAEDSCTKHAVTCSPAAFSPELTFVDCRAHLQRSYCLWKHCVPHRV